MGVLTVVSHNQGYPFRDGDTLLDIAKYHGLAVENPCSGKGICGKCKVEVLQGSVNEPGAEELEILTDEELSMGIRLGCCVSPSGEVTVNLPDNTDLKHRILAEGYLPDFKVEPVLSKTVLTLTRPTLENNLSCQALLEALLGRPALQNNLPLLRSLPGVFKGDQATAVYSNDTLIGLEPGDTREQLYGLAADIGTTTVAVSLVDLNKGREIASETAINPQKAYGLDVLSRIDAAKRRQDGLKELQHAIVECLNQLTAKLCGDHRVSAESIYEAAVAANATMMHLLLGIATDALGKTPFATVFSRHQTLAASELGLNISPFARVYCLPGVSSYIGADIVAGILVSRLNKTQGNHLLIDLGTNCEIVLSRKGSLSACSCAAGPALEGMNISCGMRAAQGAIESVSIHENRIRTGVIGQSSPSGICGSGILDAVSEIVRVGLIASSGRIKSKAEVQSDARLKHLEQFLVEAGPKRKIVLGSPGSGAPAVTQGDIRQVQLAKGAILSGLYALSDRMGITLEDLDEIVIAGQFGKHLSVDSLVGVGILPAQLKDKVRYIGNASKSGALMCLLSRETRESMEKVAETVHYVELSLTQGYERLFARCLNFS